MSPQTLEPYLLAAVGELGPQACDPAIQKWVEKASGRNVQRSAIRDGLHGLGASKHVTSGPKSARLGPCDSTTSRGSPL